VAAAAAVVAAVTMAVEAMEEQGRKTKDKKDLSLRPPSSSFNLESSSTIVLELHQESWLMNYSSSRPRYSPSLVQLNDTNEGSFIQLTCCCCCNLRH